VVFSGFWCAKKIKNLLQKPIAKCQPKSQKASFQLKSSFLQLKQIDPMKQDASSPFMNKTSHM